MVKIKVIRDNEERHYIIDNIRELANLLRENKGKWLVFQGSIEINEGIKVLEWMMMIESTIESQRLIDSLVVCMFEEIDTSVAEKLKRLFELEIFDERQRAL